MSDILPGFYRVSIKALILNNEKKFMLFLEENGLWELPGGGLDFGEKSEDCLKRELNEESALEIVSIGKHPSYFVTGLNSKNQWKVNVLYEVQVKDLKFTSSDECVALKFFSKEEAAKEKLYPTVAEFIKQYDPEIHA